MCKQCPVVISQTLTVESAFPETNILEWSSMPEVSDWCPVSVCLRWPDSTSQTRMEVSKDPLTTWEPSNCEINIQYIFVLKALCFCY